MEWVHLKLYCHCRINDPHRITSDTVYSKHSLQEIAKIHTNILNYPPDYVYNNNTNNPQKEQLKILLHIQRHKISLKVERNN